MFFHLYRGKYLFFRKTQGQIGGALFKLILLAASAVRVLLSPLAYGLPRPRRDLMLTKAKLYFHLMTNLPTTNWS